MTRTSDGQFRCYTKDWKSAKADLCTIRETVFIREQGVQVSEEWDGLDSSARHFLIEPADTATPLVVGCARILEEPWQGSMALHIGRVAVLRPWRKLGVGTALMTTMLDWCSRKEHVHKLVFLHAQLGVIAFYEKLGFAATGPVFIDAGIEHRTMVLRENVQN